MRGRPPKDGGSAIDPSGRTRSRGPKAQAAAAAAATTAATIAAQQAERDDHEGARVFTLYGKEPSLPARKDAPAGAADSCVLDFYRRREP